MMSAHLRKISDSTRQNMVIKTIKIKMLVQINYLIRANSFSVVFHGGGGIHVDTTVNKMTKHPLKYCFAPPPCFFFSVRSANCRNLDWSHYLRL